MPTIRRWQLKAEAERWLAEFVTSLGAVFPEPGFTFPCDDEDDEPLEVRFAAGTRVRFAYPDALATQARQRRP